MLTLILSALSADDPLNEFGVFTRGRVFRHKFKTFSMDFRASFLAGSWYSGMQILFRSSGCGLPACLRDSPFGSFIDCATYMWDYAERYVSCSEPSSLPEFKKFRSEWDSMDYQHKLDSFVKAPFYEH